jgi:hypothetical protein
VQRDAKAGAIVVATRTGTLKRVKFAKPNRLAMGTLVQVRGTKVSVVGHAHKAKLHGVVVRRGPGAFALAGNGSVLFVASATPPPAGHQITTVVQVSGNTLSDDDGEVDVAAEQAPGAKLRGAVLSQSATSLVLSVPGFPAGIAIGLGDLTIPVLGVGTRVEAKVALSPDRANPDEVVLTLVSLHTESAGHGDQPKPFVTVEGEVTDLIEAEDAGGAAGAITIWGEHGNVTFVIPAGFGPTNVMEGDLVEAKGAPGAKAGDPPTLLHLEISDGSAVDEGGDLGGGDSGDSIHGPESGSGDDGSVYGGDYGNGDAGFGGQD